MKFKVFKFNKVKSTNNTAIKIIKTSNVDYGMIISENQSNGKGQYGKNGFLIKEIYLLVFFNLENFNINLNKFTKLNCLLVKKILTSYYKKK